MVSSRVIIASLVPLFCLSGRLKSFMLCKMGVGIIGLKHSGSAAPLEIGIGIIDTLFYTSGAMPLLLKMLRS